ncbi:MAG: magnesium transporter CorA family protein [Actinomycetota bacterium]|nr:magnesium transporter CorA family protein [Actinomycetota bacterium]
MAPELQWIDLCDPDEQALRAVLPAGIHETALTRILATARDEPRPRLDAQGDYIFGVLAFPAVNASGALVFQEVDVIATLDALITIRKTPAGHTACEFDDARNAALRNGSPPGLCLHVVVDEIAERFLTMVDGFDESIDELEDHVKDWPSTEIREQISTIRHDILHVRRALAPTRDAARAVLDDRVELDGDISLFPRDIELRFADAYDKLLRATDGLDLARDLLAGVRDFQQAEIANNQNEVMKRLTVVASVLLLPTFIVGLYGQNFKHIPELEWAQGYGWSWAVIVVTTALQLWYFRRKRWI